MSGSAVPNHIADPGTDWHTYQVEWTPDYVSWSYDGKEVSTQRATDGGKAGAAVRWLRERDQHLIMNFWTPTFWWGGGLNDDSMPWYAEYDWVQVETYDERTKSFNFHWKDEFDYIDRSRWEVAWNGGFPMNTCEWSHDNVYTRDGSLVLKMEKK